MTTIDPTTIKVGDILYLNEPKDTIKTWDDYLGSRGQEIKLEAYKFKYVITVISELCSMEILETERTFLVA